jgi:hypothetical protein
MRFAQLLLVVIAIAWRAPSASSDTAVPAAGAVPCRSIADCWLDEAGQPIKRPRKLRGRQVPRGDCGANIFWLHHRLECIAAQCHVTIVGDRC